MNKTSKSVFALSALTLCSVLAGCGTTEVSELKFGDIDLAANAATITLKDDSKIISWAEPKATTAKINFYGYKLPTNAGGTKLEIKENKKDKDGNPIPETVETALVIYLRKKDSDKEKDNEARGYFTVDTSSNTFEYYNSDVIYSKFTINLGKLAGKSREANKEFNYFECGIELCKGTDGLAPIASLSETIKFTA